MGREALCIQGFPVGVHEKELEPLGDRLLLDLAGNAFTGTVVVCLVLSLLLGIPWQNPDRADKDSLMPKSQEESAEGEVTDSQEDTP